MTTVAFCIVVIIVTEMSYWFWVRRIRRRDARPPLHVVDLTRLDEDDVDETAGHRAG